MNKKGKMIITSVGMILIILGVFFYIGGNAKVQEAMYGNHDMISSLFIDEDIKSGENFKNIGVGIIVVGIALLMVGVFFPINRNERQDIDSIGNNSSLEFLKQRYAKGEINKEEFDQMKKDIEGENE